MGGTCKIVPFLLLFFIKDVKIPTERRMIMGFFDKLKSGLNKTKESINDKINDVFSNFRKVDEDFLEELEEALIMSDIGIETSTKIIKNLRERMKKEKIEDEEQVKDVLREEIAQILEFSDNSL